MVCYFGLVGLDFCHFLVFKLKILAYRSVNHNGDEAN